MYILGLRMSILALKMYILELRMSILAVKTAVVAFTNVTATENLLEWFFDSFLAKILANQNTK
ncbi:MAG: hypothetical protein V4615_12890, partial [Bacteroidota bacterium]